MGELRKNKSKVGVLNFAYKVLDLIPRIFEKKGTGVISYGENNNLPEIISQKIGSSITATECVDKIKTFIEGKGFKDKKVNAAMANEKQTFRDIHRLICSSIGKNKAFYLNIQYDPVTFAPSKIYSIPFSRIRVNSAGEYIYCTEWGNKTAENDAMKFPAYDKLADETTIKKLLLSQVKEHKKQIGVIVSAFYKDEDTDVYCKQSFLSGWEDIESDAALQVLENRNIKRGFKTNVIISTQGEIDDENEDEDGKTDYDYWVENLKKFSGEDAPGMLHLYAKNGTEAPQITAFDLAAILDGVDKSRDRVGRKVCQAFGVPPMIVGFDNPEGWGNSNALMNRLKLFVMMVEKYQELETSTLKKIFPAIDFTIEKISLIEYIPDKLIDALTNDEKRVLAGKEPLPVTDTGTGVSLAEKLGVGSTTSLFDVIRDTTMTPAQKYNSLVEVFNLAPVKASRLIYGVDEPPIETPPA